MTSQDQQQQQVVQNGSVLVALVRDGDTVILDENSGERLSMVKLKASACVGVRRRPQQCACGGRHLCHEVSQQRAGPAAPLRARRSVRVGRGAVPGHELVGQPYGAVLTLSSDGQHLQRMEEWCVRRCRAIDRVGVHGGPCCLVPAALRWQPTGGELARGACGARARSPVGEWAQGQVDAVDKDNAELFDRNAENQTLSADDIAAMKQAGKVSVRCTRVWCVCGGDAALRHGRTTALA